MPQTYRLVKFLPDKSDDACTIQSIRALDSYINTRGPEHLRTVLAAIADALRENRTVTVTIEDCAPRSGSTNE